MFNRKFRFWIEKEKRYGAHFALCTEHEKDYKPPSHVRMDLVEEKSIMPCNKCTGSKGGGARYGLPALRKRDGGERSA